MADARRVGRPPGKQGEALLEVARTTFVELGFEGTTMHEVAARARVSKSSLYREHPSKDALFATVVTDWTHRGRDAMRPALDALLADANVTRALRTFAMVLLDAVLDPSVVGMRRLVAAESERFPDVAALYQRTSWEANIDALASTLAELDRRGRLRVEVPRIASEQLVWMTVGAPLNARTLGSDLSDGRRERVGEVVTTFLARFGAPPPSR